MLVHFLTKVTIMNKILLVLLNKALILQLKLFLLKLTFPHFRDTISLTEVFLP